MKAILTLVYEATIDEEDRNMYQQAVNDGDDQFLSETFGIGWDGPESCQVIFEKEKLS